MGYGRTYWLEIWIPLKTRNGKYSIKRNSNRSPYLVEKDVTDTHYACEKALHIFAQTKWFCLVFGEAHGSIMQSPIWDCWNGFWIRGSKAVIYANNNRVRLFKGPATIELKKENFQVSFLIARFGKSYRH